MSRIVLHTSGSLGDLHPYMAVAIELQARGHRVAIASAESYRRKIESESLEFRPVRPDFVPMDADPEIVRRAFEPRSGAQFLLQQLVLKHVHDTYCDMLEASEDADLILICPTLFAAPLVAEKLQLKWLSVVLSPGVFVSAHDPPVFPPFPWLHPLRHLGPLPHRVAIWAMKRATKNWMAPLAELRRREGLSPGGRCAMHDDMFSPHGTLAWYSRLLGESQADWPAGTQITGFAFFEEHKQQGGLDAELATFLDAGPPPVVFTLGSAAVVDADNFFDESRRAVESLGCRAVFLTGNRAVVDHLQSDQIYIAPYAPYTELFPQSAAIVHQGGIGTTGQALRAGTPSLIVPRGLDQPDNAHRAERLGVARVLARNRYCGSRAARHLAALLSQVSYARRTVQVQEIVRSEKGAATAATIVEQVCVG